MAADDASSAGGAMCRVFLSYARGDDEPFVRRLYEDLTRRLDQGGKPLFRIWFDRECMPSRQLTFHHDGMMARVVAKKKEGQRP